MQFLLLYLCPSLYIIELERHILNPPTQRVQHRTFLRKEKKKTEEKPEPTKPEGM